MAYVTVPKDLTKIKSKMLFGLTKRQLVCFGSAALVGVPLFFLSKGSMGTTPAALCMILVMLPFFLFALYEKNGQTPEALLGHLIQCKFTRPKKRVYQTNNAYSALEKQAELERTVGRIASGAGKRGKGRRRLTRQERKQIEAVIRQAKGDGKNHTVQASLPFRNMHPDGLCRLDDRHFSKTIAYADVSYRLAGPDDQRDIFERLCDFYNGYDPSIGVQMTLFIRTRFNRLTLSLFTRRISSPCEKSTHARLRISCSMRFSWSGQASRLASMIFISGCHFQNSDKSATLTLLRPSLLLTMQNPQFLGQPRLKKP